MGRRGGVQPVLRNDAIEPGTMGDLVRRVGEWSSGTRPTGYARLRLRSSSISTGVAPFPSRGRSSPMVAAGMRAPAWTPVVSTIGLVPTCENEEESVDKCIVMPRAIMMRVQLCGNGRNEQNATLVSPPADNSEDKWDPYEATRFRALSDGAPAFVKIFRSSVDLLRTVPSRIAHTMIVASGHPHNIRLLDFVDGIAMQRSGHSHLRGMASVRSVHDLSPRDCAVVVPFYERGSVGDLLKDDTRLCQLAKEEYERMKQWYEAADGGSWHNLGGSARALPEEKPAWLNTYDEDWCKKMMLHKWFVQLASAVSYTHGVDVVHCDIKPDNLLVTRDGDVVLSDWEFACLTTDDTVSTNNADDHVGTPSFCAPELFVPGHYDPRLADVYAMGVVLYMFLNGGRALYESCMQGVDLWTAARMSVFSERVSMAVEQSAGSDEAKALLAKMLCYDPEGRPTAAQVLEDPYLQQLLPEGYEHRAADRLCRACSIVFPKRARSEVKGQRAEKASISFSEVAPPGGNFSDPPSDVESMATYVEYGTKAEHYWCAPVSCVDDWIVGRIRDALGNDSEEASVSSVKGVFSTPVKQLVSCHVSAMCVLLWSSFASGYTGRVVSVGALEEGSWSRRSSEATGGYGPISRGFISARQRMSSSCLVSPVCEGDSSMASTKHSLGECDVYSRRYESDSDSDGEDDGIPFGL